MSALSSFFPSKFLPSMSTSTTQRQTDNLAKLRFVLETMPGSRKYVFTPATRAEILSELYTSFWGSYSELFLPATNPIFPTNTLLSTVQIAGGYGGAGGKEPVVPGRPCGHIFTKGESCFRCRDCSLDDSCVLCARCFHATDHTDHNVSFYIAQQPGGCCDCGDEEAWRNTINCPFHPAGEDSNVPFDINAPPTVKNYPNRSSVPADLRESMARTIGVALDFILDTLDYSPDEPGVPANDIELRIQPTADPMDNDQYCIILWNDDKHTFPEVIKLILDTTSHTLEEATRLAHNIDETGREVIDMSTNIPRLLEISHGIAQIDLGVTVRRGYDTFREQVMAVIIEWLLDLTKSRLNDDVLLFREIIASELLVARKAYPSRFVSDLTNPVRVDWMFVYHTKLWKKLRLSVKEIYASVLSLSKHHKLIIAGHFADVYHHIIDAYLLTDREAETSIKYFALQLFTVPSVASHIVNNHGLITRLLSIITAFFTNQITPKSNTPAHITLPPTPNLLVDVDSFPFKSKRFMPVFSDLRYLCANQGVKESIGKRREWLVMFIRTCSLFMCVNPNRRAREVHVEYEADAWISVFNVTLSLSRVIKVYGDAYAGANVAELVYAIGTVMHHILMVCTLAETRLDREKFFPIAFQNVEFAGGVYNVVRFDVSEGWVSFHHSLHWLLAELFKHVHVLSESGLRSVGYANLSEAVRRSASVQAVLSVVDFPLRVLTMIAQIRTGLWVRNGFAIRGQLLHYRDYMLRELCYDQDLFLLQTSLVILDPSLVFVSILTRFNLLTFFTGSLHHAVYEPNQLMSMVEEVMYIFITILSERANAARMSTEAVVRREIVHALAMGPCSFTDLSKRVAERLVDDVCFEKVLSQVAVFKMSAGAGEGGGGGVYEMREEGWKEVDVFFYHYTRNRREEVEGILLARAKKQNPMQDGLVIVPQPMSITSGPFVSLNKAFESEVLVQVMFYGIYNILAVTPEGAGAETPPSGEAILDQTVHLVMLALVERSAVFSAIANTNVFEPPQQTLVDVLCRLEVHDMYNAYRGRVKWILQEIGRYFPDEVVRKRVGVAPTNDENEKNGKVDLEEGRKLAAKTRKEAIMAQMKKQQQSFAFNFDEGEDLEDEDEEQDANMDETSWSCGTCIVCQEDLVNASGRAFGALGMLQPSRLIRRHPDSFGSHLNEVLQTPASLDRSTATPKDTTFPPKASKEDEKYFSSPTPNFEGFPAQYTRFGLHGSVCTHMMHLDCFQVYSLSVRQRHRAQATRNHPENIPRKEFICPLCKSLGNVVLPVTRPSSVPLNSVAFPDWIRAAGIGILKSKADPLLDSLQFRNGTGEFVFWSAQDPGYASASKGADRPENVEVAKMLETVMSVSKTISQQTRHLRDRPEPEIGERGTGIYLPEEMVGYTIAAIEVAQRGVHSTGLVVDNLSEAQTRMIRGLLTCLTRLAALQFKTRPDEGRDAIRQAIVKRLLPEWSRTSLTSFSFPLLLRDPFTLLVETAAVAPEMIRHVLVLAYYACLARTVIGLVYVLNKSRSASTFPVSELAHGNIFGDVRMFFMSVVRHSPVFEHTATVVLETFGEARIEKLMYAFTLPFLRRAAILCRSVLPGAFPTPAFGSENEYTRILSMLGIPPLADLPNQDTLQNALSGWCAHYGHSHAASQLNCGVVLDYPAVYHLVRLPIVLDTLFGEQDRALMCARCNTAPVDAAICLICGTITCMQSHCCVESESDRGECNIHTRECAGTVGLYFLVKRCSLLYLYANNGTFAQAPYLDAHGEVDISMRRGRRQYLHHARWEEVRKTWLNHGIPTVVARKLESTVDSGGWETL